MNKPKKTKEFSTALGCSEKLAEFILIELKKLDDIENRDYNKKITPYGEYRLV